MLTVDASGIVFFILTEPTGRTFQEAPPLEVTTRETPGIVRLADKRRTHQLRCVRQ